MISVPNQAAHLTPPRVATVTLGKYRLRQVSDTSDLRLAQALRYQVFNIELNEGLPQSHATGLDADPFDSVCEHLLVERVDTHHHTHPVVGTYRMQTGPSAARNLGYYSEREFDLTPFASVRHEVLELGRACIHADHRNFTVLSLLWRGIATYAQQHGARYLLGCSSINSTTEQHGPLVFASLAAHWAPPHFRTLPQPGFACQTPEARTSEASPKVPKLLSAYMALGAWICGPAAIDREFKTLDFLTLMDLASPEMAQRRKRFGIA